MGRCNITPTGTDARNDLSIEPLKESGAIRTVAGTSASVDACATQPLAEASLPKSGFEATGKFRAQVVEERRRAEGELCTRPIHGLNVSAGSWVVLEHRLERTTLEVRGDVPERAHDEPPSLDAPLRGGFAVVADHVAVYAHEGLVGSRAESPQGVVALVLADDYAAMPFEVGGSQRRTVPHEVVG